MSIMGSAQAAVTSAGDARFARSVESNYRDNAIKAIGGNSSWQNAVGDVIGGYLSPFTTEDPELVRQRVLRRMGMYTGVDRADQGDALKGISAVRAGMISKGINPSDAQVQDIINKTFMGPGGGSAGLVATEALGKRFTAEGKYGNNQTDVMHELGVGTYIASLGNDISQDERNALTTLGQANLSAENQIRKQSSNISIAGSNLAYRRTNVRNVGELAGAYEDVRGQNEVGYNRTKALYNLQRDKDSEYALSLKAQMGEYQTAGAGAVSGFAHEMIGYHGAEANVLGAYHDNWMGKIGRYGNPGDFGKEATRYGRDIDREIANIEKDMRRDGLTPTERKNMEAQRVNLVTQKQSLVPNAIGQDMNRYMLGANTQMAEGQAVYGHQLRYGNDSAVEGASDNIIKQLDKTIQELNDTLKKQGISADDAAKARQGIASAYTQREEEIIKKNTTLFNRVANEYNIKMTTDKGAQSIADMVGTSKDILGSGTTIGADLDAREAELRAQLKKPGLTIDQRQSIQKELAGIPAAKFGEKYNSTMKSFDREDVSGYGYDTMVRSAQRERNQYLPFSPGSSYKLDLEQLQTNQGQIKVLDAREATLKSQGMFGPQQKYDLEQKRQGLYTQDAAMLHDLSEGMIDRLPAFSAGRPSGFHNYDSIGLAQMQLSKVSHPSRYFGALNGQQAEFQDSFARSFAVPGTNRPYSKDQAVDMAPYFERMIQYLGQIAQNGRGGNSGNGQRQTEQNGQNKARIDTQISSTPPAQN